MKRVCSLPTIRIGRSRLIRAARGVVPMLLLLVSLGSCRQIEEFLGIANHPPTVSVTPESLSVGYGESFTVTCDAADPDGDEITIRWFVDGGAVEGVTGTEFTTALEPEAEQTYEIVVEVSDGELPVQAVAQVTVSGPWVGVAPEPVRDLVARSGDGEVLLSWTNPTPPDLAGVVIRRSAVDYPAGPEPGNGYLVCDVAAETHLDSAYLANGSPYYYSVFAYDTEGLYSEPAHVEAAPADIAIPTIVTPAPGSVTSDTTPLLDWVDQTDTGAYEVRYAPAGTDLEGESTHRTEESSFELSLPQERCLEVAWQLRSLNVFDMAGDWTAIQQLYLVGVPVPVSPSNGSATNDARPLLDWRDVDGAAGYEVAYALDAGALDGATPRETDASEYRVENDLSLNDTVYWQVRSLDGGGRRGDWSEVMSVSYPAVPLEGLVAEYLFNGNVEDTSGNANHATPNGVTGTSDRFGVADAAYAFDGNDDILTPVSAYAGPWSVSLWVKPEVLNTNHMFFGQLDAIELGIYDSSPYDRLVFYSGDGNNWNSQVVLDSGTAPEVDRWSHLVVVSQPGTVDTYRDAMLLQSVADPGVSGSNSGSIRLGERDDYGWDYYHGAMDEVRIYNRVLSQEEITRLFSFDGYVAPVSALTAAGGDGRITLSWDNPGNPLFSSVRVVRNGASPPVDSSDGDVLYSGMDESFTDDGVTNDHTYHYGVFALDTRGLESAGVLVTATPFAGITIEFEQGAIPTDLSGDWIISTNAYSGSYAMMNRDIGNSQSSSVAMEVEIPATGAFEVRFQYSTSTENGYDYLRFDVDGTQQQAWAGSRSWSQYVQTVTGTPGGIVQLRWRYTKDGSVSSGSDTVYVDDIEVVSVVAP